jgi:hypothetical protein
VPKIKDLGIKVIPETMRPPEIGGGGGCGGVTFCQGGTLQPCAPTFQCYPTVHCYGCTLIVSCFGCTHGGYSGCLFHTFGGGGCGAISPYCGASYDPTILQQPGLTHEQIATLKDQLQKQIAVLDEIAKTAGPSTVQEIDAREKQLNEELAHLKSRRKEIDKK